MTVNRILHKANTHRIASSTYSNKSRCLLPVESLTELKVCQTLEFDTKIKRFVTQPYTFKNLTGEGDWRQYTPDLLIEYITDDLEYGEIKSYLETLKPDFYTKFKLKQQIVKSQSGKELKLFTDEKLTAEKIKQCEQLKTYLRLPLYPELDNQLIDSIGDDVLPLSEVQRRADKLHLPRTHSMTLLAHQQLRAIEENVLTNHSLVEVAHVN